MVIKMVDIFVDKTQLENLKKKYAAYDPKKIDKWVESNCERFSKMNLEQREVFGFEKGKKFIFNEEIKDSLPFYDTSIKNPTQEELDSPTKNVGEVFTRRGQIESFWEEQPFFYDKSKIFWLWNKKDKKWELSDEIDFLNSIQKVFGIETIGGKTKTDLVEGFKQVGRLHKPKPIKKTWVQFKDNIYDLKTGEVFNATPEYFITNPIPFNVGKSEETPTIDKLFGEWVDEKWKQTLYEILAYNISGNKFMQRIFALVGGGSNGKGTFIKMNKRFLGVDNCVSSEMKNLSEDKFEPAVLYRKLLCVMGEVSYGDLRNTNMLKKLGGEDDISFQFKGKTPFTDENTATCICLTNSLPVTPDKQVGFYRKWLIVDFKNQFSEIKNDLIGQIPDIEFDNLANKCLRILKELYETQKFTNEGNFEERTKRYEERSNPVMRFVEESCVQETDSQIILKEFSEACNNYLKQNHQRLLSPTQISKILRYEGFDVRLRTINSVNATWILGLQLMELTELTESQLDLHRKQIPKDVNLINLLNSQREKSEKNNFGDAVEVEKIK